MNEPVALTLTAKQLSTLYSALTMRASHIARTIEQFDTLGWNEFKEKAHMEYAETKELRARVHGLLYGITNKTFGE